MSAAWPYRASVEAIADALRTADAAYAAGRPAEGDTVLWKLRRRVGLEAIERVREMPVVADQPSLFDAEPCRCCGTEPIGDRDGVRCGRCAGPRHRPCGGGCGGAR